jgi:DNA-binding beta-propeller fold protein YncE
VATGYAGDGCNAFFEGFLTIGYDASSGDQTWMEYSTDYSNIGPGSVAIEATSDGTEIVQTGMQISLDYDTSPDYGTIAYRPDGSTAWWDDYDGVSTDTPYADDEAADLAIVPGSNDVIVIGSSKRFTVDANGDYTGGPWDGQTVAYSETGALLWTSRFVDPVAGGDVYPEAIAAAPDGSAIYVAGAGEIAGGGWNAFVVSYAI